MTKTDVTQLGKALKQQKFAKAFTQLFVVVSFIIAGVLGTIIQANPSYATENNDSWVIPDACYDVKSQRPLSRVDSGIEQLIPVRGSGSDPASKYGTAGATFSHYYIEGEDLVKERKGDTGGYGSSGATGKTPKDGCYSALSGPVWSRGFAVGVNSVLFSITTVTYRVTAWLFQNAFSGYIGSIILGVIDEPIKLFKDAFVMDGIIFAVALSGIWLAVKAAKGNFREGMGGVAWTLIATIAVVFMLANPHFVPNNVSKITNSINTTVLSAASTTNGIDICANAGPGEESEVGASPTGEPLPESPKAAVAMGTCAMWNTFVFTPWSNGQFGVPPQKTVEINGKKASDHGFPNWALYQYAAQSKLPSDPEVGDDAQATKFGRIIDAMYSGSNADRALWVGDSGSQQFLVVLLSIVAMAIGAWLIGSFSAKVMVYNVVVSVMLFFLPFVAIISPHPTVGKRAFMKYVGKLVGFGIRPIVYAIGLTVAMIAFSATSTKAASSSGNLGWFMSIIVLAVMAVAINKSVDMMENMLSSTILGDNSEVGSFKKGGLMAAGIGAGMAGGLVGGITSRIGKKKPGAGNAGKPSTPSGPGATPGVPASAMPKKDPTKKGQPANKKGKNGEIGASANTQTMGNKNADTQSGSISMDDIREQRNASAQADRESRSADKAHKSSGEMHDKLKARGAKRQAQKEREKLQQMREQRRQQHAEAAGLNRAQTNKQKYEARKEYKRRIRADRKAELKGRIADTAIGRKSAQVASSVSKRAVTAKDAIKRGSQRAAESKAGKAVSYAGYVTKVAASKAARPAGAVARGVGKTASGAVKAVGFVGGVAKDTARGGQRGARRASISGILGSALY